MKKKQTKKLMHILKCCMFFIFSVTGFCFANAPSGLSPTPQQQGRTISGVVRDATETIIGANVMVKGTTSGVITDINGQFTISNVPLNAVLQVSYIGYKSQEVNTTNQSRIEIVLVEDVAALEEIVVIGYGTMQRRDVTGAVGQVQSDALQKVAAPRIDQALVGQIAGVQVISSTGQPGEGLNIRVRGVGSISAGSNPLYVIDGFPEADIRMLNPNDIETMDILKDASATAIYGSRGANGVILITTKRGKGGKASINLDVNYGWQKVLRKPQYLTKQEQAMYYYEGIRNQNLDAGNNVTGDPLKDWGVVVPKTIMDVLDGKIAADTEAYDYIFQTAPQQSYNLSAQGGNDQFKFSISGEYLSQDGIIIMNDFNRYSIRSNIDAKLNERVTIKFNINSGYSTTKDMLGSGGSQEAEGILGAATTWVPWYPLYTEDGEYFNGYGQDAINNVWNPVAQAYEIKRRREQYRTSGNLNSEIKITNELNLNIMVGATTSATRIYAFVPKLDVFQNSGDGIDDRRNMLNWSAESILNYQKKINKHSINALVGFTTQKQEQNSNYVRSQTYPNNLIHTLNAVSNIIYQGNSNESEWSLVSYLTRLNYNYNSKYYLSASIRSDGSSRFGKDRKYGYFPSAALSWRISEEDFLKEIHSISDIKLRASYGETGNNNIGDFAHLATVGYSSYLFGGEVVGGMAPGNIENPLLTWEKQRSLNFGADFSLFKSRLNMTVDYFITTNHQLLLNVNVPQITGFNTSLQNIGEVENRGWEFTINSHNLSGVVDWSTNFNFSTYRNKVLKLGPEGAPIINSYHITQIGQPIGMFYGYQTDGIFKNQAELDAGPIWAPGTADRSRVGDIRFVDTNGDGEITTDDRTIIGNPYPDFYFGLTNNISYKNFALSFSISGSYGNKAVYNMDNQLYTRARFRQFSCDLVKPWWKSESDPGNGIAPRPNNLPTGGLRQRSDRFLDDASFLRVNNINLSYTVPRRIAQSLYLSNLRVYATSNNPFIFTKFKEFNPEVQNSSNPLTPGIALYNYPIAKSLLFGINVTF